jgi:hypothetical protein
MLISILCRSVIQHGFETGIRSKLRYKLVAGKFLNNNAVQFPDYQHFAGNRFFFQLGDPVGTFRMLDYYQYSTSKGILRSPRPKLSSASFC